MYSVECKMFYGANLFKEDRGTDILFLLLLSVEVKPNVQVFQNSKADFDISLLLEMCDISQHFQNNVFK